MFRTVRTVSRWVVALALVAGAGCDKDSGSASPDGGGEQPASLAEVPSDQSQSGWTEREQYFLEVVPKPNPIPFQELFELRLRVWQSDARKQPAQEVEIDEVRARMPAHDHGMKTAPEVVEEDPGTFRVRGMRFHMQGLGEDGRWVIEVVVDGPRGLDRARFPVYCCRP